MQPSAFCLPILAVNWQHPEVAPGSAPPAPSTTRPLRAIHARPLAPLAQPGCKSRDVKAVYLRRKEARLPFLRKPNAGCD